MSHQIHFIFGVYIAYLIPKNALDIFYIDRCHRIYTFIKDSLKCAVNQTIITALLEPEQCHVSTYELLAGSMFDDTFFKRVFDYTLSGLWT